MFKKCLLISLSLIILNYAPYVYSQGDVDTTIHTDEVGLNFSLAMSGFGIGGFYRKALGSYTYLGANLSFYMMRDDKEYEYYDAYYAIPVKANDVNRLFFIPLNIEFKKRLFADDIEDSFRPHILVQGGIIYGMNFPKVKELKNESEFSYNFAFGFGIDMTNKEKYFITIRPQYRIIYFSHDIAQKKNHSNFEIKLEIGGRLF
jgi:hypothetical protein